MSEGAAGPSVFPQEHRVWVAIVQARPAERIATAYSYTDRTKQDDVWVRQPPPAGAGRIGHLPHDQSNSLSPVAADVPLERACDLVQRAFPGERVTFTERSTGWFDAAGLRLNGPRPPLDYIDINRLIRGH